MFVRLQKFLAEAGVASRRASELIILDGRVAVNGKLVRELGSKIDPAHDRVTIDGAPIKAKRKLYLALNKPPGYICSRHDPFKRRSVYDLLPKEWLNVYTVGRLDFASEGLIFLTNDGQFSLQLTHPRYGVRKQYRVILKGKVTPARLGRLSEGVWHEGERLKADRTRLVNASHSSSLVEVELREGKNREVRRLFEVLDLPVERLQRIRIGSIKLGELPSGKWRTLTPSEVKSLLSADQPQSAASPRSLARPASIRIPGVQAGSKART